MVEHIYHERIALQYKMLEVLLSLQRLSPRYDAHRRDHFVIKYLGRNEIENTFGCLSGAQMGSNHEKNRGRKSCDTLPLTMFLLK